MPVTRAERGVARGLGPGSELQWVDLSTKTLYGYDVPGELIKRQVSVWMGTLTSCPVVGQ
jgi:hypothetical protein